MEHFVMQWCAVYFGDHQLLDQANKPVYIYAEVLGVKCPACWAHNGVCSVCGGSGYVTSETAAAVLQADNGLL